MRSLLQDDVHIIRVLEEFYVEIVNYCSLETSFSPHLLTSGEQLHEFGLSQFRSFFHCLSFLPSYSLLMFVFCLIYDTKRFTCYIAHSFTVQELYIFQITCSFSLKKYCFVLKTIYHNSPRM